jgi:hypothetical protein
MTLRSGDRYRRRPTPARRSTSTTATRPSFTDPALKWKTFTSDAFGNLTQVTEPDPGGGANVTSNYAYTALNQLTLVTMTRNTGTPPSPHTRPFGV